MKRQERAREVGKTFKKWSEAEVTKILEYILRYGNLEKPTAKIYYTKLIKDLKLDVNWSLVMWKIRNLKRTFQNALEYETTTGAVMVGDEDCSSIKKNMVRICPNFDLLSQIFYEKNKKGEKVFEISEQPSSDKPTEVVVSSPPETPSLPPQTSTIDQRSVATATTPNTPMLPTLGETKASTPNFASRMEDRVKPTVDQLSSLQTEGFKYYEKKLELEQHRLELKQFKMQGDLELRREKQKQDFEIKKLKIEKDERVAKYEIEMRYKTH